MNDYRGSEVSKDQFSTEMELYGVSPGVVAFFMILITATVPLGFIPESSILFPSMIYGLLWVYTLNLPFGAPFGNLPIIILDPIWIYITLPLTILNVVYAIWVVRYYKAKTSRYNVAMVGLVSIILPPLLIIYFSGMLGGFELIYPIPIQFILGLIILWRVEGPEVISPWSGMRLDLSWWKRRKEKRKSDWDLFEEEKKAQESDVPLED
jgi:hypothetical protein